MSEQGERYVLDGIETAMIFHNRTGSGWRWFSCPCGHQDKFPRGQWESVAASLRFHYTHCSDAKVNPPEPEVGPMTRIAFTDTDWWEALDEGGCFFVDVIPSSSDVPITLTDAPKENDDV